MSEAELARLQRRLDRERKAREEAERIAERGLRDLYEANRELDRRVEERTQELFVAQQQAQAARVAISSFLANLSHDLKTPVNGVLGMLELLQEEVQGKQAHLWVSSALESSQRLGKLLSRLLSYVDLESGAGALTSEPVSIAEELQQVADVWQPKALHSKQLVSFDSLLDAEYFITVDRLRFKELFDEILDNVVMHANPGMVRISAEIVEESLHVSVQDSGPGIATDTLQTMLQPFRRGDDSSTRAAAGSGLGLALCARICEVLQFQLKIDSAVGQPTTVTIGMPAAVLSTSAELAVEHV